MMMCWIRLKQSAYLYFISLITLAVMLTLFGCGNGSSIGSGAKPSQTSSATLKIRWHDPFYQQNSEMVDLAAALDCQAAGVEQVVCQVYDNSGNLLTTGGPWPCMASSGRIDGIPAGSDRTFVVLAEDADGGIRYHGQMPGITIKPDQVTEGVVVEAYPFIPSLTAPEEGVRVDPNSFPFEWESIETTNQYLVQVAEDRDFQSIIIDDPAQGTIYVPSTLAPMNTYFWRVSAVDSFGNVGVESQVRSFTTSDCTYAISPTENSFGQPGGSGSFDVTSSSDDCGWLVSADADWITITTAVSGAGDGAVNYTVAANPLSSQRTGIITVGGQTHAITQEGLDCSYQISPQGAEFTSEGGSGSFQVISSISDCEWLVSADEPWVEITSGANGRGTDTVNYQVEPYSGTSIRDANIFAAGEAYQITQNPPLPQTCTYTIAPVEQNVLSTGERYIVRIVALGENCSWGASSNVEWISVSPTSGSGNGGVEVAVQPNIGDSRLADIIIAENSHTVSQNAGNVRPTLISPINDEINMDNGCLSIYGTDSIIWDFDWRDVPGATQYQIYVIGGSAINPLINRIVTSSTFHYECTRCYIIENNRYDWNWRVRAGNASSWSQWSDIFHFDVEPLNQDCLPR